MLHPLLVHMPIGCLILAFLLEQVDRYVRKDNYGKAVHLILAIGMVSALMSVATGLLLAGHGGYDAVLLWKHQWMGIALAAITTLLYGIKRGFLQGMILKKAENPLWWVMFPALVVTGHYGGSLTHGENYLFALKKENTTAAKPFDEAFLYEDLIQPILAEKCQSCHRESKAKGSFRMDSLHLVMKGGKSGPAILAGKPLQSRMLQYILLPDTSELHMPPVGNSQLLPHEVALIEWWIQCGAPASTKISQLEPTDRIRQLLYAIKGNESGRADIPTRAVKAAPPDTLAALRALGVLLLPVATGSNYLKANLINTGEQLGEAIARLNAVKEQLIWLETAHPDLADRHIKDIGELKSLTKLNLSHACFSDTALTALAALQDLQWLNLYDTPVTDQGLKWVTKIPSLRSLYLYQTYVTPQAASATQQALPDLKVEFGGYQTAFYPSDTITYKYIPAK
jgi:uncharacterized membrane protein